VVILAEVGDISRFANSGRLAAYCGTVLATHASGGKHRSGRRRTAFNRYLKWAFVEAGNAALMHRRSRAHARVVALYDRVKAKQGHGKASVAMARHLAESAFWVLTKQAAYRLPNSSKRG
jgi:transposase